MVRIVLRPIAEAELAEAMEWYAARSHDAARRFVSFVDFTLDRIALAPESFPRIGTELRRAIVPHFPYGVYFIVVGGIVHVIGIVHSRRHPQRWLRRE